jgi:hypothetical protein
MANGLNPPPFADGLDVWSREDGTPGTATYANATDAAFVPADQDFGGCLEIVKTQTTQRLRYMGQTPITAGRYLRVTARVKAISGAMPAVRIAGYPAAANGAKVSGVTEAGPSTQLTAYGQVVEVSAIIGTGERTGVDMVWGGVAYGHFGIDITGPNGGLIRVDDIEIADITAEYSRDLLDWVDVIDFGAVGDGITDDAAAFAAADAAANGRQVLVPAGLYYLGSTVTMDNPVRFEGKVTMPPEAVLVLRDNYELNTYVDAFGDEVEGFRRAFQALLNYTDHEALDLNGRQIDLDAPIDMQAAVSNKTSFATRRVIRNGTFAAQNSSNWAEGVVTATASYSASDPLKLKNVSNIGSIEVGSLVEGAGVGREVYVQAKNVSAGELTLSSPLFGAAASQSYTFRRFRYILDFTGFSSLSKLTLSEINFQGNGYASGVILSPQGSLIDFNECHFTKPAARAITSPGRGCQGMQIDGCRFFSNESPLTAANRSTIAFNVNANDLKLRNSWFQHFRHTAVLNGTGHMIVGNHWFQGDSATNAFRPAGIIFTAKNVKSVVTGNYIDNASIEMTNEHDEHPDFSNEFSFGGLSITGNIFTTIGAMSSFAWIVIRPHGTGHYLHGLSVTGNTFRTVSGNITRVERVDTSFATLDFSRFRNVVFEENTFNGVDHQTISPVTLAFQQNSAAKDWVLNFGDYLPFGGYARTMEAVTAEGPIRNASNAWIFTMPFATVRYGSAQNQIRLTWSEACKGKVQVTARVDNPT